MYERLEELKIDGSVRLVAGLAAELGTEAWLAGGGVRDCLLGRQVKDLDFAVGGYSIELPRLFAQRWGGTFFWLDEERLQARVVKKSADGPLVYDFAPLRGKTIEEDLWTRDFTINALALPVASADAVLIDPLRGEADLRDRLVRACSDHVFDDDPLRLLRALRFAAELGYDVEEETWNDVRRKGGLLGSVAAERTRDELFRILAAPGIDVSLRRLAGSGLLRLIFPPELRRLSMDRTAGSDHDDRERRIGHAETVERFCSDPGRLVPGIGELMAGHLAAEVESDVSVLSLIKLAAFLGGVDRTGVAALVARLRLGRKAGRLLELLCRSAADAYCLLAPDAGERSLFRFFRDREPAGPGLVIIALAAGAISELLAARLLAFFAFKYDSAANDLLLTGNELMALGEIRPGKRVGEAMEALREAEISGRVNDREEARSFIKNLLTNKVPVS